MKRATKLAASLGFLSTAVLVVVGWFTFAPYLTKADAPVPVASYAGSFGFASGAGKLDEPVGLAVADDGQVFVTDSGNNRIVVFDRDGNFVRSFGSEGEGTGELDRPMHVTIGSNGLLYVAEYLNDRISVFQQDGSFIRHVAPGNLDAPGGVAVAADGTLYIADFYHHVVRVVEADGQPRETWGRPGRVRRGSLHYPTDVELAPDGSLWVADAYNNRLQRFVDGKTTHQVGWGLFGRGFGFRVATGVESDARGRIYGVDFYGSKIRVFDADGTPLTTIGEAGTGDGQFDHPTDAVVANGRLYVADFKNNRIQMWNLESQESARDSVAERNGR